MKWGRATHIGLVRQVNEDSFCVCPDIKLYAVADGMGGHLAGEVASCLALQVLEREVRGRLRSDCADAGSVLIEAIKEANRQIYRESSCRPECRGMGTTVAACLVRGSAGFVAHVGDSRVYLVRGAAVFQLTEDHTLVQELARQGDISDREMRKHPYRNVLTRALGTAPEVEVDLQRVELRRGDKILLCTDGLTEYLDDEEIGSIVNSSSDPDRVAGILIDSALGRGGGDNVTVVLVVVD